MAAKRREARKRVQRAIAPAERSTRLTSFGLDRPHKLPDCGEFAPQRAYGADGDGVKKNDQCVLVQGAANETQNSE